MQPLTSYTQFERLDAVPGRPVQYVAANCNGIQFIALPVESADPINLSATEVLALAPRVNGVPLLPIGASLPAAADRLEIQNPPGVLDKTVYEVTLPAEAQQAAGVRLSLMLIRRHVK